MNFIDNLDEDQVATANQIGATAQANGLDPAHAIATAMAENNLRNNDPSFSPKSWGKTSNDSGAYGPMQVTPKAAIDMGYKENDIYNPQKNIEIGVKYLKHLTDRFGNDADGKRLASIAYNAGPNHDFFNKQSASLPDETKKYLSRLDSLGAFSGQSQQASSTDNTNEAIQSAVADNSSTASHPNNSSVPASQSDGFVSPTKTLENYLPEGGAAIGATANAGGRAALRSAGSMVRSALQSVLPLGHQVVADLAPHAAEATAKAAQAQASVARANTGAGPTADQATRIAQGGNGDVAGTTGRARQAGYNAQTAQEALRAKQAAGIPLTAAEEQFLRLGDVTSSESGILLPKASATPLASSDLNTVRQARAAAQAEKAAQAAQAAQDAVSANMAAKAAQAARDSRMAGAMPTAGTRVGSMASSLGGKLASYGGELGSALTGPTARALAGGALKGGLGGFGAVMDAQKAYDAARHGDWLGAGINGLGVVGGGLMMVPTPFTEGAGLALSGLSMAGNYLHNR